MIKIKCINPKSLSIFNYKVKIYDECGNLIEEGYTKNNEYFFNPKKCYVYKLIVINKNLTPYIISVRFIPVVIFSSIILILTLATIHSVNNYKLKLKGQDETKELHDNIKKIKDIDKEKIEEKSLSEINNWNVEKDNFHLGNSKELGQYLYRVNNHSTIYDVYELTYKINNSDYTIYTAVVYNDLNNDNINQIIPEIHGATITKGNENLWGYDTIKDLYYDINTPEKSKLEVTKGLYMEK